MRKEDSMLEIVRGQSSAPVAAGQLAETLGRVNLEGTFFIGYPVLANADETVPVDGLLIAKQVGLCAFILDDQPGTPRTSQQWEALRDEQDALFYALTNNLSRNVELRVGRRLAVEPRIITILPEAVEAPNGIEVTVTTLQDLPDFLQADLAPLEDKYWDAANAALQRVSTIKPRKKRQGVQRNDSRGAILKQLETKIANLDRWQKPAAIESPEGPQRIRGLAGSGKTVVLALKAAYLHAQHPDWTIAITFYSRALGQQFRDLVRRFCFEHTGDEPDWDRVHILHAWGGRGRPGFYNTVADKSGSVVRDFAYAKATYGMHDAFAGICRELEAFIKSTPPTPIFDAVLIDEAQDLPLHFFRIVYAFTKLPHRIVWAYDELQNLSEAAMPSTADMFGSGPDGHALISVDNRPGEPREDIVLPVCYRNTPWALSLAHALGFGIYRDGGLVQHFDNPVVWQQIGYRIVDGQLDQGQEVRLERSPESYPSYFTTLLTPSDSVQVHAFENPNEQTEWVAAAIRENLRVDELEHDDIAIVLPDAITAKKRASALMQMLRRHGIESHLVGETTSADDVFLNDSIAIMHIYRAKGNEAPMVYVLDAHHCSSGPELIRLRNTLFTAITRSRAWVRICGWGLRMASLREEIEEVQENGFQLEFTIPTEEELLRLRTVHRELSATERKKAEKAERGLKEFLEAFREGALQPESLDPSMRRQLELLMKSIEDDDADRSQAEE
jgi:superfamily I DNA and RNA helicase